MLGIIGAMEEEVAVLKEEEYQINHLSKNWDSVNQWRAAAQEIQEKGSTIINIPLDYDKFIHARLMKTQRGGVYLETKGINKEYASVSEAFTVLQQYAKQKYNELMNK